MKWIKELFDKGKPVNYYMVDKNNFVKLILFTALFSILFINLYKPFGSDSWYNVSPIRYFIFSFILVLTGILVIAFSRFLMYRFVLKHSMHWLEYALWIIGEIVVLSAIYTIYTIAVNDNLDWFSLEDIVKVFSEANINTFLIILLPYSVSWLYFSYEDKKSRLRNMENKTTAPMLEAIQFPDEKGEIRFTVMADLVVYMKAADNYVSIYYQNNGKLTEYVLRNSLKRLSELLENTSIHRIHRSYMVNFAHIVALRKTPDGISLELDVPNVEPLLVSKTFATEITDNFLRYSKRS